MDGADILHSCLIKTSSLLSVLSPEILFLDNVVGDRTLSFSYNG